MDQAAKKDLVILQETAGATDSQGHRQLDGQTMIRTFCLSLFRLGKIGTERMNTKSWKDIKDEVYGEKGTSGRDELDREFESFRIGLFLRKAREEKNLTRSNWRSW